MSEIELKPCPFCGGKAKFKAIGAHKTAITVGCTTCCASSKIILISAEYCANEHAAKDWNQRANEPECAHWDDVCSKVCCSRCGASNKAYKSPYCPHCGAKMEGAEKNES